MNATTAITASYLPDLPEGQRPRAAYLYRSSGRSTRAEHVMRAVGLTSLIWAGYKGQAWGEVGYEIPGGFAVIVRLYPRRADGTPLKKVRKMVMEVKQGTDGLFGIVVWYQAVKRHVRSVEVHATEEGLSPEELELAVLRIAQPDKTDEELQDILREAAEDEWARAEADWLNHGDDRGKKSYAADCEARAEAMAVLQQVVI